MIEIRHPEIENETLEIDAYNEIYSKSGLQQLASFYLWLIELLDPQPGQSLLDVSCGQGKLVDFALIEGLYATGIDFSEIALQRARAIRNTRSVFNLANAQTLPFAENSFDFVTNIGSIEHYLDPARGVREINRVLKRHGVANILLPNGYSLLGNIKHVWQTGDVFDDGQPIQRYNTLNGWRKFLIENGLVPFKVERYEMVRPRVFRDFRWYLARPIKSIHLMLTPLIPLPLVNCFVYLCRPVTTSEYP